MVGRNGRLRPDLASLVIRVLLPIVLVPGFAVAQTSYTKCTLSNGLATGFFGGVDISGTYTLGLTTNTSNISVDGDPNSVYRYDYTFTGPLNGPTYTQTSKMPPPACILGPPCAGVGTATLHIVEVNATTASLSFEDSGELFDGHGTLSCATQTGPPPPPAPTCGPFHVSIAGNGVTSITASYTPSSGNTLQAEAANCGYQGFDWQQQIILLPCPSPFFAATPQAVSSSNLCSGLTSGLTAGYGTGAPFLDPITGGYTNLLLAGGAPYNPSPFYYPPNVAINPGTSLPAFRDGKNHNPIQMYTQYSNTPHRVPVNQSDALLSFSDTPADPCLPGSIGPPLFVCGFGVAPEGSILAFQTALVGILPNGEPSDLLIWWTWTDSFNGTVGGIAGLSSAGPVDPGSGTGNITITSINGVPVPPIVPPTQIATTTSGLAYSRVSQTFNGTVTVTNMSAATITTPTNFQLVLTALPAGVTLANSVGTFNQSPYITIPAVTSLAPGQSVSVAVRLQNPSEAAITFLPEFYAGSFQQ